MVWHLNFSLVPRESLGMRLGSFVKHYLNILWPWHTDSVPWMTTTTEICMEILKLLP